ncbi:MAG TPA: tetratricopeptide repeat protein [Candidatus Didemnitutus sp.]|nr:tetratricopeptide repeat protein [Candidatus Didemnitutus sp.]
MTEGKFAEAEAQARAGLAVAPKALGPAHLDTLQGMDLLAESLLRQGKLAEAEKVARSALEKRPVAPREGWQRFAERSLLGAILVGQGRYVEAEPLLVAAAEGLAQRRDQIPAANRGVLDVATARVTQLHAAWPGPEKKIIGG